MVTIGVGLVAALLCIVALASWNDRLNTVAATTDATTNLGIALAEQLARSMQAVDMALQTVVDKSATLDEAQLSGVDMHDFLVRRSQNLAQSEAISLISASGIMVNSSRTTQKPGLKLSDRDYFKYFSVHNDGGVFVNPPVRNVITGDRTFILARRLNGPGTNSWAWR